MIPEQDLLFSTVRVSFLWHQRTDLAYHLSKPKIGHLVNIKCSTIAKKKRKNQQKRNENPVLAKPHLYVKQHMES